MKGLLAAALVGCWTLASLFTGCGEGQEVRRSIPVGTSRSEVLTELGEPTRRELAFKQTESIWGPPEEWWSELEMGESYESWFYTFAGEGTLHVYFLRESPRVDHVAFVDEGVVFESDH